MLDINDFIEIIVVGLGFLTIGILFGFSLIGIEFVLRFYKSNSFETKRWKYTRVRKDNAWPYEWLYRYAIWSKRYNKEFL